MYAYKYVFCVFPGHDPPPRLTSDTLDRAPACTAPRCLCYTLSIIKKKKTDPIPAVRPPVHLLAVRGRLRRAALHPLPQDGGKSAESHQGSHGVNGPKKKTCLHLGAGAGLLLVVENVRKVVRVSSHPVAGGLLHAPYLRTHLAAVKAVIAWNLTCGGGAVGLTALVVIITLRM